MPGGPIVVDNSRATNVDFFARLVDQFFRRWFLYLLPVVLLALVGFRAATNVAEQYVSQGTLSASENPLVGAPEVRGTTIGAFEPPASGISRLINEQMRSDSFVETVGDRAGLGDALESGLINTDVIRRQVGAGAQGENLLVVQATWGDPQTAFLLVDATINTYLDLLAETVAVDSLEATSFWSEIRDQAQADADEAEAALTEYVRSLDVGPEEELSVAQQLDVERLSATFERALADVASAQERIDSASLNVAQTQSEAGRQVRVVDPPEMPTATTPETFKKLMTMAMFTMIGIVISGVALVVTTMADHSIRSVTQLLRATDMRTSVIVPKSKALRNWSATGRTAA